MLFFIGKCLFVIIFGINVTLCAFTSFFHHIKVTYSVIAKRFFREWGGGHLGQFSNFRGGQFEGQVGKVEGIKLHNT